MKARVFKEGELGKALALGESMYEEDQQSEIGKLLQGQQTSEEIIKARQGFFKIGGEEKKVGE